MNTIFRWTLRTSLVLLCGLGVVACSGDDDLNNITADDTNVSSVKIAIAFEELDAADAQAPDAQAFNRVQRCISEQCGNSPLHKAKADAKTEEGKEKGSASNQKPAGADDFSYADVTSIKLDVLDPATNKYFTKGIAFLQSSPGVWEVTLPILPKLNSFTFIAHAFDVTKKEIFTGSITQPVASDNQIVNLTLAPSNNGATVDIPAINKITVPMEFVSGQTNNIVFSIKGKTSDDIHYVIDTLPGAGSFAPATGDITLYNVYGSFVAQYTPPAVQMPTDFTHSITVSNAQGNAVTTTFTTHVVKQGAGQGPHLTGFNVHFNPVINSLSSQRFGSTSNVLWAADVIDDKPAAQLSYLWTFAPSGNSPMPDFIDETTNGTTMTNYSMPVAGTLTLAVTDSDGGTTTIHTPIVPGQFPDEVTVVGNPTGLNSIRAGGSHTCAMLNNGTVRCFGEAQNGQLGYGNEFDIGDDEFPYQAGDVQLGGFGDVSAQVTTGGDHTCALFQSGMIRCWGKNNLGQLGYGDNTGNMSNVGDAEAIDSFGYVQVGSNAVKVVAGANHTCAILDTGNVRCWGDGAYGKLGYGNTVPIGDNEQPYDAGDVSVGGPVKDLALGANHTCALLQNGHVRCWGYGAHGQLGTGSGANLVVPSGDVNVGGNVVQISAGDNHTCALLDTGFVRCWGLGNSGQLGYGNFSNVGNSMPVNLTDVNTGGHVLQVSAGGNHTCVLLATGDVKCWGSNASGQLGNGQVSGTVGAPPASVIDLNGSSAMQITTGTSHTCALLSTGNAWCWGNGGSGRLGYKNTTTIGAPTAGGNISILTP